MSTLYVDHMKYIVARGLYLHVTAYMDISIAVGAVCLLAWLQKSMFHLLYSVKLLAIIAHCYISLESCLSFDIPITSCVDMPSNLK